MKNSLFKKLPLNIKDIIKVVKSSKTPLKGKLSIIVLLLYIVSPIDLIPDFIPIIGYLDDLIILPILIFFIINLIPHDVWKSFEEEAKTLWQNGKPKKWGFAVFVILFWSLLIAYILYLLIV